MPRRQARPGGRGLKSVGFISSQQPEPQTGGTGPARAPAPPLSEEGLEEGTTKRASRAGISTVHGRETGETELKLTLSRS